MSAPLSCAAALPLTNVTALTAGAMHACAVLADGGVVCWGFNDSFRAGIDGGPFIDCAFPVALPLPAVAIAAGVDHTCVTHANATRPVSCWGIVPDAGVTPLPVPLPGLPSQVPSVLVAGERHTCVGFSGLGLVCVGDNGVGQLGGGLIAAPDLRSACAGLNHTCLVRGDGGVECWGHNDSRQVKPQAGDTPTPTRVNFLGTASEVFCGAKSTCATVGPSRELFCWGDNSRRQIDPANTNPLTNPGSSVGNVGVVGAGWYHMCFTVSTTGSCRGDNLEGQASGMRGSIVSPAAAVPGLPASPAEFAIGAEFTCARSPASEVWCWGLAAQGQLGRPTDAGTQPERARHAR